jgi:hypothetical protein
MNVNTKIRRFGKERIASTVWLNGFVATVGIIRLCEQKSAEEL